MLGLYWPVFRSASGKSVDFIAGQIAGTATSACQERVPRMSSGSTSTPQRTAPDDYSVTRVRETLSQTLRGYIEGAQYCMCVTS